MLEPSCSCIKSSFLTSALSPALGSVVALSSILELFFHLMPTKPAEWTERFLGPSISRLGGSSLKILNKNLLREIGEFLSPVLLSFLASTLDRLDQINPSSLSIGRKKSLCQ